MYKNIPGRGKCYKLKTKQTQGDMIGRGWRPSSPVRPLLDQNGILGKVAAASPKGRNRFMGGAGRRPVRLE